jgi:hypothetical protein
MGQIRQDAVQLAHMSDTELEQTHALELVDDMATVANDAYGGQSTTGGTQSGIVLIHSQMLLLAIISITPLSQAQG